MNNTPAPVFRGSVKGYKKSDVNEYVMMLSRRLEDSERSCSTLTAQNSDMLARIRALEADAAKVPELLAQVTALSEQLRECTALLESAQSANSELQGRLSEAEERADSATAEYNKICHSAGQIFALAGNTADDILKRADVEAHRIVNEAHNAKNVVFQSISETTEGFTSDLSDFVKGAISDCIEKINETASEYVPKSDGEHKVRFIKND